MAFPFIPERLYCVAGWPLAQSLSPLLHNAGFQRLGLPAVYMRCPVPVGRLSAFVESARLLRMGGVSVTIPHKEAVIPLLDRVGPRAREVGAVNTLYWEGDALCGENTDMEGFLAPLGGLSLDGRPALLLGAGGAAAAVAAGLARLGRGGVVATPSNRRHEALAARFSLTPVRWEERHEVPAGLVVNATPLGMRGPHEEATPYDFGLARALPAVAYDVVYNPLRTRFLREAAAAGVACVSGGEMFFAQGDAQFRLWTGRPLPGEARAALDGALGERERKP